MSSPPSPGALILAACEGQTFQLKAGPFTVKLSGTESGGTAAVWEDTVLPSAGPPAHIHHKCEEMFLILDGDFVFQVGETIGPASRGAFIFIPRGMVHTYRNIGQGSGKLLGFVTPSGLEQFLIDQARIPAEQMNFDLYLAISKGHDMDIVGGPLSDEVCRRALGNTENK